MKEREILKVLKTGSPDEQERKIRDLWDPPKIQTDLIPRSPLD